MKYPKLYLAFSILLLSSCAPINYYQLFETKGIGNNIDNDDLVFEDENCKIFYDLWGTGGDVGFILYNKSESYITLDLAKSFFVINGVAYDYYLDRTYTTATAASSSKATTSSGPYFWSTGVIGVSGSLSSSSSSSIKEKPSRTIPPKTYIRIKQFSVTDHTYTDCDFIEFPERKKVSSVSFEQSQSPYQFYNLLNYYLDDSTSVEMKNEFYIEKITNYPEKMFFSYNKKNKCGEEYLSPKPYFTFAGKERFYLKYK